MQDHVVNFLVNICLNSPHLTKQFVTRKHYIKNFIEDSISQFASKVPELVIHISKLYLQILNLQVDHVSTNMWTNSKLNLKKFAVIMLTPMVAHRRDIWIV